MLVWAFYWHSYSPPPEKTPGLLLTNIPPPPTPGSLLHTTSVLCSTQTYMTILFLHFIFWIICYGNITTNLNVSSRYLEKFSCLEWRFIKYFSILGTSNREKNFISMKYFDPDTRKMPKHLKYFLFLLSFCSGWLLIVFIGLIRPGRDIRVEV